MPSMSRRLLKRFATPLAPQLDGQEMRTVVFLAVSFHAVFIGYRSIQNLQSSLNEENGLGVISLGVLYGAWIFSGILTPTVIRFLTTKGALMVAWVCHVLYTAATFYPAWELLLPASILLGAVSAPLWTSQSLYITACGFSHAKHSSDSPYHIFSRFNGIFYAIYETSQITGNLVSSLVLQNGVSNRSDKTLFRKCGRGDCPAADNSTDFEEPENWVIDTLLAVYVTCNLVGLVVTYFFVMPLPKTDWSIVTSTKETVTSFFVLLRDSGISLLVPMFIFQGMQQAILYSEFTRSYISCPIGIHMVGFVMAAHGATTPIVTLIFSRVVKHTGRYPLFLLAGLINLGLMVVMDRWTPGSDDVAFIFLVPICWGISEGIWMTQSNSLIAVQFSDRKEPAFSVYHTSRSVGLALTFAYSNFMCAWVKVMVGVAFVLIGLLFYTVAEIRTRWKERIKSSQDKTNSDGGAISTLAGNVTSAMGLSQFALNHRDHSSRRSSNLPLSSIYDVGSSSASQQGAPTSPGLAVDGRPTPGMLARVSSVASSSSSILSSLTMMVRLSQGDDDDLTSPTTPSRHKLSGSVSEESVF